MARSLYPVSIRPKRPLDRRFFAERGRGVLVWAAEPIGGGRVVIREGQVDVGRDARVGALFDIERGLECAVEILLNEGVKLLFRVVVVTPAQKVEPL